MQPILRDFLHKWVYPTGFTGAGVEFRLRQTERCLPLWDKLVAQAIQAVLFNVNPHDPLTIVAVIALLLVTALAASGIPALRAASVDPLVALRDE